MAGTVEGNRKAAATLKAKYGLDMDGKSVFHKRQGAKGDKSSNGYFNRLKREDPERLAEIARNGAKASNKAQGKGGE